MIPLQEGILDFASEKLHCVPIAGSWWSDLELVDLRKQRVCINKSRTLCRNKHKCSLWLCQHVSEQSSGTQKHQSSSETLSSVRTLLCLAPHTWPGPANPDPLSSLCPEAHCVLRWVLANLPNIFSHTAPNFHHCGCFHQQWSWSTEL